MAPVMAPVGGFGAGFGYRGRIRPVAVARRRRVRRLPGWVNATRGLGALVASSARPRRKRLSSTAVPDRRL